MVINYWNEYSERPYFNEMENGMKIINNEKEAVAKTIEYIDELLSISKFIDYSGRIPKKKIKKSKKIVEEWRDNLKEAGTFDYDVWPK